MKKRRDEDVVFKPEFDGKLYLQRRRQKFSITKAGVVTDEDIGTTISLQITTNGTQFSTISFYPKEWEQIIDTVIFNLDQLPKRKRKRLHIDTPKENTL